ncbi:hypothetical protein [Bosea sp. (in: a-proteobacteria)]|uniref:hypothetical protein n=1 Tax=Bosea sp. (in: a-proteobacteria) TaxID=1871050 RepID=UPI002FC6B7AF
MNGRLLIAGLLAGLTVTGAGLSSGALAAEKQSAPIRIEALDKIPVEFTRHNREHRMWEIQRNMERQQRARGRDRSYGHRRGYDYRRGYDRGPGYGHRRGYGYDRGRGHARGLGVGPGLHYNHPNSGYGYSR